MSCSDTLRKLSLEVLKLTIDNTSFFGYLLRCIQEVSNKNYNDLAGYGNGSKVAAKATSATSAVYSSTTNYAKASAGATTASKATSATSATYSSTANYAKSSAGATTASKATSATSATYSSTANYAKAVPSTVASRISTLETGKIGFGDGSAYLPGLHFGTSSTAIPYIYHEDDNIIFRYKDSTTTQYTNIKGIVQKIGALETSFQGGCNTIMQAVTAKGSTPASNSPADIATAIGKIASIESSSMSVTWSGLASAIAPQVTTVNTGDATASKSITLAAGKTYILFCVACGAVVSGYSADNWQNASSYPNQNWRIQSFTVTSNKTNNTIEVITEQGSMVAGNGTFAYKIVRIKSTVSQTITATGRVTGFYKPSVAVGICQIYAQ